MTYEALKQSALREADQRDLTDNPHVGGGEPDRWDDDGTSDKLRALVAYADRFRDALSEIAERPGASTEYIKGVGEIPLSENEHMAKIARAALGVQQ